MTHLAQPVELLVSAALLLLMRVGSALVTMPVFSSPAIPARVKAMFAIAITILLTPVAATGAGAKIELSAPALLGEAVAGLGFGLTLSLLQEAILFAASLMGTAFSFSLANLIDPNSQVETEVLGVALRWMSVLVLLAAGLHRTMLSALLRTLVAAPLGSAMLHADSARHMVTMASGIFSAGVQLAAPVVAAALLVEVAVGLVSRMAPALPAQIASVPVKTLVSYAVLIGSLAVWPAWIEGRFESLLRAAERGVRA